MVELLSTLSCSVIVMILLSAGAAPTSAQPSVQPAPFRVAVIGPQSPKSNVTHLTQLLMQEGYPYDYLNIGVNMPDLNQYSLIIIYQEGLLRLTAISQTVNSSIEKFPGSLIWIGPGISSLGQSTPTTIFGVKPIAEGLSGNLGIAFATSGPTKTAIENETVTHITLAGTTVDGYFTDNASNRMFPAETHMTRPSGSIAYYFAYDVSDWWKADPQLPWSRPTILASSIQTSLSNISSVLLRTYPMNLDSMFIERIEDVDSLHNAPEWVNRAQTFLQAFTANKIPLSVALIPIYVSPSNKLNISIDASSATPVRNWLWTVVQSGGTIIQHGDTHQWGQFNSGAGTEFLVNGTWMSYSDQAARITQGRKVLEQSFPIDVIAFEAPHYKADNDTINALVRLGFKYYFDDPNSPFFSFRYGENSDLPLVVFPETLSYVPLNVTMNFEHWTRASIDELIGMSGILLQYDHLYDDNAYKIGVDTMKYILQKGDIWTPTIEAAGEFELERAAAYANFKVVVGREITVSVGPMAEAGLTLSLKGGPRISWVEVNGKQWSLIDSNYVILPALNAATNTITIGFDTNMNNQTFSTPLGLLLAVIAIAASFLFARRIFGVA